MFIQVLEAAIACLALWRGGGKGVSAGSGGILVGKYGYEIEGHFGSNGDFYGRDGNTYRQGSSSGKWWKEE